MSQSTPLKSLIQWYQDLPSSMQVRFACYILTQDPNLVNEVNRVFIDSQPNMESWTQEFQDWLEYNLLLDTDVKNRKVTVDLVLRLRNLISSCTENWDVPLDNQLYSAINTYSIASQIMKENTGITEEEVRKKIDEVSPKLIPNISETIEIKQSWDKLYETSLSDKIINKWLNDTL
jgi:hypothetical protein